MPARHLKHACEHELAHDQQVASTALPASGVLAAYGSSMPPLAVIARICFKVKRVVCFVKLAVVDDDDEDEGIGPACSTRIV
jgi:hypothetical protein